MGRPKARQVGLALVSDLSVESFGPFLHTVAKKPKGCVEGISELTRQQLIKVCEALERHVQLALDAAGADPEEADQPINSLEDVVLTLQGVAMLATDLLTRSQQPPPDQLLNVAVMLHDGVLMSQVDEELVNMHVVMQDAVMRLCCAWWERRLPGNDMLVARTIPYVLLRAIESLDRNRASLVHMCYVIRDALELLDYEDEAIKDTKRMLLLAAMHPAFLREPEGRRFIAGLFHLEPQMTRELGAIVRNQIPSGQRFALEAYGEILFRAWRDTVGPCAAEVESELQALMQATLLASTPALAAALRLVLNGLHSQKDIEKRMSPALVRLYDPILPRAFDAANAEVRRNAVQLLVAAFPIVDPEAPADEINSRLTHQLGLLMESLTDPCPAVREAAVEGSCRCLKYFWEIIPAATSAKIIGDITTKLAFDGSSRAVRIAVLRGLIMLVDSQHAQPVLKKALQAISGLLQDTDPGVREALTDLLVAVSSCRGLHFWGVVPLEQLLEAMAADATPAVARKIARVLVPSYFPNAEEGSARLGALLRSKPEAGHAFCRNMVARFLSSDPRVAAGGASEYTASVPLEQILQLAGDLASHLLATADGITAAAEPPAQPVPKRAKGGPGRNKSAAVAGKKRAKKKAADAMSDHEDGDNAERKEAADVGPDNGTAAGGAAGSDDEDMLKDPDSETEEGWLAILEGLAIVAQGIGAAVVFAEECGVSDVAAVLPGDTLIQLLRAAEEQLRKPKAVALVLQIVASVHFTPGAQSVRDALFARLIENALPGMPMSDDEAMELDGHHGPQGIDARLLSEMLKTLVTGSNGPKLVAILSAALGVREPLPLRKPVVRKKAAKPARSCKGREMLDQLLEGSDEGWQDGHGRGGGECRGEEICEGCRRSQPEDTMLLCDGCDAACHTHCLRPALQEVPESDWFCWRCETQLQAVQLPAAAAGRCVCLLLQHEEGRELLCDQPSFGDMIQAMHQLAVAEADEILRLAQAVATDEADSPPADEGAATDDDGRGALLGDPWGALSRYCRAALHRAMWAALPRQRDQGSQAPSAQPTPRRTPASARRGRRGRRAAASDAGTAASEQELLEDDCEQAPGMEEEADGEASLMGFFEIVPVIDYAVQTCGRLAELVMEEPCLNAQLAALQYSQGLLRVLHVVHQTDLMNMSGRYVATVADLCSVQAAVAHAVVMALAGQGGGSSQQQACVAGTVQVVLGLTHQMAETIRRDGASIGDGSRCSGVAATPAPAGAGVRRRGGSGEEDVSEEQQQLEARMDAAAAAHQEGSTEKSTEEEEGVPSPAVSVERLAVRLLTMLCDPAVATLLKGPVRLSAAALVGELLTATRRASSGGWLGTLCQLTGEALMADPRVAAQLEDALRCQVADSDDEAAKAGHDDGAAGTGLEEEAGDAVRGVRRPPCRRRKVAAATAGTASSKAQQATAAKLAELIQKESPALGTMATVLVRVCVARKAHGHAMLLLARLAGKAIAAGDAAAKGAACMGRQDGTKGDGHAALGATVLLALCQAAAPAGEAAAPQRPPAARRKAAGRCGALAEQAATQAARAEWEAVVKALGVLRSAVEEGRVLQPLQQQAVSPPADTAAGSGDEEDSAVALRHARCLARALL